MFKKIESSLAWDFLKNKHYAGRRPQIKYSFGAYENGELKAVVTYGIPASRSLCVGIMGKDYFDRVIELNRLCRTDDYEQPLSKFVSWSLKQIKKNNLLIVSYSDLAMNHYGIVYQACNFLYTGKTKQRTDKYTDGNKHSRHYNNENNHLRKVRSSKHRYIYFACSRGFKKLFMSNLKYEIIKDFPKGDKVDYKLGEFQKPIIYNTITNEYL